LISRPADLIAAQFNSIHPSFNRNIGFLDSIDPSFNRIAALINSIHPPFNRIAAPINSIHSPFNQIILLFNLIQLSFNRIPCRRIELSSHWIESSGSAIECSSQPTRLLMAPIDMDRVGRIFKLVKFAALSGAGRLIRLTGHSY
jgi:hypothetical protein